MKLDNSEIEAESITDLLEDGSKRAIITDSNKLTSMIENSAEIFKYTRLNEKILTDHWGFLFQDPNNFMFTAFNRKVVQLVESGIAKRNVEQFISGAKPEEQSEPCVLTLDHMGIWFLILLGCLLLSLSCIIMEFAFHFSFKKRTFCH